MGLVFAPAAFQALPEPWNAVEPADNIGRGLLDNGEVEYDDRDVLLTAHFAKLETG